MAADLAVERASPVVSAAMKLEAREWSAGALAHSAFDSVRPYADRLAGLASWPPVATLDALLRDRLALDPGVALEHQVKKKRPRRAPLDRDSLYVIRVARHARVPTRERSWHDLTNALVWAAFPRSKRALAKRLLDVFEARVPNDATSLPSTRTREEDALAMLDEGGVVLATEPDHVERALEAQRASDHAALRSLPLVPHVFGHALMEHAVYGDATVRAYAVVLAVPAPAHTDAADEALARWITETDALTHPAPWRAIPLDEVLRAGSR